MKKTIVLLLSVFFISSIGFCQLEVGKKASAWKFPDSNKKMFSMRSWPGKVLQINYVDPDVSDLNDHFNDVIDVAADDGTILRDGYKGFGIVDCKASWKPNFLIKKIAGNKAKKYDTTILFDTEAVLRNQWGLDDDSYSIIIVDKQRIVRYICKGRMPDADIQKVVKLLAKLSRE
ncbi:YtfJ family protein [Bacteroidota bacterium]